MFSFNKNQIVLSAIVVHSDLSEHHKCVGPVVIKCQCRKVSYLSFC